MVKSQKNYFQVFILFLADERIEIVLNLLKTVKTRLLHPGAHTELIITFYSLATQALNQLG
jgi:hypothetical protein